MDNIVTLQNGLTLASACFPVKASVVRELFTTDHEFRDLCDDYALSFVSLARFQRRPNLCAGSEIAEYSEIMSWLCEEISQWIRNWPKSSGQFDLDNQKSLRRRL
ncbi:MAG: hypothetical protein WBV78_12155 [Roseobacter sp.]